MLANLMPGLRHVRTPLAAGYLYLLVIWLLLGERLMPEPSDDSPPGRAAQLAETVGTTATLAALSFAAYLMGSIVVIERWPWGMAPVDASKVGDPMEDSDFEWWAQGLDAWTDTVARRVGGRVLLGEVLDEGTLPRSFVHALRSAWRDGRYHQFAWAKDLRSGIAAYRDEEASDVEDKRKRAVREWRERDEATLVKLDVPTHLLQLEKDEDYQGDPWFKPEGFRDEKVSQSMVLQALTSQAEAELTRVAAQLRVESESVFNEYDRMRSEAELRYTVVPALALAFAILAVSWHWWAVFGFLILAVLVRQAYLTERASVGVVIDALRYGIVESPTAQSLIQLAQRRTGWDGTGRSSAEPDPPGID